MSCPPRLVTKCGNYPHHFANGELEYRQAQYIMWRADFCGSGHDILDGYRFPTWDFDGFIDPQLLGCGECQDEGDHIPAHLTLVLSNLTAGYINGGLDRLGIISGVPEYCDRLSVDLF